MVSLDRFMPSKKRESKPAEPPESPPKEPVKAEKAEETFQREERYPEEGPHDEVEAEPEEVEPEEYAEAPEQEEVIERTVFEAETPKNTGSLYLLSVTYSGSKAKALLKLYNLEKGKTVFWYDNTGHLPYCLTDLPLGEVLSDKQVASHPGFDRESTVEVEKYDLLHDKKIRMTKVVARDPLSIGGRGRNIRDFLQNSWEDNIRYHDCYIYDRGLIPGYSYRIKDGHLIKEDSSVPLEPIREKFQKSPPELLSALKEWFPLFISPVPDYRRVAIDIEVATEALDRIPDPSVAKNQVICASLAGSDGLRKVLLLKRVGVEEGIRPPELPEDVQLEYFEDELVLIKVLFKYFLDYPIVITFNGDNFDLHYLWRRAQVLGMKKEDVPIMMGREIALLPTGVHIDLYKFMHNHAIQIYAFGNSYREVALDAVASAFLNIRKIQIEKTVSELGYLDLASYCFRDSLIALRLTTENSNMVMNLITMIMRISRLSMEDVTRQGISRWIRSLFFFEHRARNYLIPRESDIEAMKGEASTTAVIKGKKYHGAIVIKPESNVYFDVVVLDFASLYPSIIARWNLSYETVRCVHQSCRTNVVPDTNHWVCTKRLGLMALIIGLLKNVRVKWFKAKSKDPALSQEERDWYKVVQQALKVFLNACFTGDTDILTTNGVRNVKDINIGDKVINVNPATLEPEVDEVVETQVFNYNGDLLHFKNGRSTDLIVTPEHRFIVADHKNGGVRFVTAEAIYNAIDFVIPRLKTSSASSSKYVSFLGIGKKKGWGVAVRFAKPHIRHVDSQYTKLWDLLHTLKGYYHKGSKTFFIPEINDLSEETIDRMVELGGLPYLAKFRRGHIVGKQNRIPASINLEHFAALCGWIISEGSLGRNKERLYSSGIKRGMNLHIDISQSAGKGNANGALYRDDIENVLKNIGVKYSIGKKGFRISNELLYEWVSNNCYTDDKCEECGFGHCSHRKRIPEILMQADNAVLGSFLNSLYCGDGTTDQTLYSTASEMLASQLPAILAKLGFSSKRFYDEGAKLFRITWRNTNQHTDHWKKTKMPYNGQVYCITTKKNHTVFAGRNGRLIPCGQSYGVFGAEIFPLYCLSMADSTTAIGRHIITETIKKATDSGLKVIYADTDSIFLYQPTKDQIGQLLSWAESSFGIDLEVDKRYTFVTFSGRKKNYLGVMDNGVVDIKGLMGKKRNTPVFIKSAFGEMTQVLKEVKTPQDFAKAKERIKEIVQNCYTGLKNRRFSLDELTFKVMLSRPLTGYHKTTPQHVKAAKQLEEKGKEVKPGDIISFVKVQGGLGVKPVQLARIDDIDVDKYVGHIESTFGQVLEALGIEFDEIVGIKRLEFFSQ